MSLPRRQQSDLAAARKVIARPDVYTPFEVEQASETIFRLEGERRADRSDIGRWTNPDATCEWCRLPIWTHTRMPIPYAPHVKTDQRQVGAGLCPVVRETGRNGDPAKGEKRYDRYFRTPTPAEVAAWHEANRPVRAPTPAERRALAKERQGRLGV